MIQLTNRTDRDPTLSAAQLALLSRQLEQQRFFRSEQIQQYEAGAAPLTRFQNPANDEISHALIAGAKAALAEIKAAEDRLVAGTFGSCIDCRTPLPLERLEILPSVSRCLACDRAFGQITDD